MTFGSAAPIDLPIVILADNTLLKILGFNKDAAPKDAVPKDADLEFAFTNLPESVGVFVFIGVAALLVAFTVRIYRRENAACPRGVKHLLAALRVVTLIVLLLVFLNPAVTYTKSRSLLPVVTVLRDASQSMNVADAYEDDAAAKAAGRVFGKGADAVRQDPPARTELVDAVFSADDWKLVRDLEAKGRLRVLDFSNGISEARRTEAAPEATAEEESESEAADPIRGVASLEAVGTGTDLARALREGISEKLTSAVVIFTDGQHNAAGELEEAIAAARNRGVPVYVVGVGDPVRPVNLAVSGVYADPQVWKGDPFEVQAIVSAQGVKEDVISVELVRKGEPNEDGTPAPDSEDVVLDKREITLSEGKPQERLSFSHTFEEPGIQWLTVRVRPVGEERNTDDNEPPSPLRVKVLDDRAKILMVAGSPNWDYRALTRLLMREPTIELACWLQSLDEGRQQQGNRSLKELPATQDSLFEYDVVLLLDPNPNEFDESWIDLLKRFVREHSGGLLYMPGPIHSGPFLGNPRTGSIKDLLPVSLGDVGDMEVAALLATNNREWPLQVVRSNVDQPIMRFFPETEQSMETWKSLPGIFWSFAAVEAKPGARVLIEHSDPTLRRRDVARPLLVTGQYGSGRTVYMGFDGSWRWRNSGYDAEFYKRFWVQMVRYLVEGRTLAGKRRGVIETARARYEVGDRVRFTARLKELNYDPLEAEEVTAEVLVPGSEPIALPFRKVENTPGGFQATLPVASPGQYVTRIELPGEGAEKLLIEKSITVTLPVKETQQTWLDQPQLREIAATTGGAYFDIDQTAGLAAALPDRIRRLEMRSQPIPIWDTNRVLILIVVLLTIEWALRKRFKLL